MNPIVVRWRAFGRDRLHVRESGQVLGWLDLLTGDVYASSAEVVDGIRAATDEWLSAHPEVSLRRGGTPVVETARLLEDEREDLADNRPGTSPATEIADTDAERRRNMGRAGERRTARVLERLRVADPRWGILHSIPVGTRGGDIDHMVVGPAGVFVVNSKYWPHAYVWVAAENAMVNGTRRTFIHDARHDAHRATSRLSAAVGEHVHVHGVVAWFQTRGLTVREQPRDVTVLEGNQLATWLHRQPDRLRPSKVVTLFAAARDAATWKAPEHH